MSLIARVIACVVASVVACGCEPVHIRVPPRVGAKGAFVFDADTRFNVMARRGACPKGKWGGSLKKGAEPAGYVNCSFLFNHLLYLLGTTGFFFPLLFPFSFFKKMLKCAVWMA